MDAELKRKWIEALRSGEYRQARMVLRDAMHRMCCLGVLATVQGCQWEFVPIDERNVINLPFGLNAGISHSVRLALAEMNDSGKSFKEIADYIEKHL